MTGEADRLRRAHEYATTPDGGLYNGPLAELYRRQRTYVRELAARLAEVDPEWLADWKSSKRTEQDE